jgi:hypothetical protein
MPVTVPMTPRIMLATSTGISQRYLGQNENEVGVQRRFWQVEYRYVCDLVGRSQFRETSV